MAKTAKKVVAAPKAAAKPRKPLAKKPAAKKATILTMKAPTSISREQVAELAHRFWLERGRAHGHHEEDWFRAEQLLSGKAS
jgi:hypothetical protein